MQSTEDISRPSLPIIWLRLMKLRVIILLQITAICAILIHDILNRKGTIDGEVRTWLDTLQTSLLVLIGGTLSAGGSNAINMWYDADIDKGMQRTSSRPIPQEWISPEHALVFGSVIAVIGTALLWSIHWKAGFWSAFSVLFYVLIYTIWLKRRTPQNIVIGGAAGATPPLIGWAAAAADTLSGINPLDLGNPIPWMLFLLIFLWTPPHFWALAIFKPGEYEKVGIPMLPNVKGVDRTIIESKVYAALLICLAFIPIIWPGYGIEWHYSVIVVILGVWYMMTIVRINPSEGFDEKGRLPSAFASFIASLRYLALMFTSLVLVAAFPL